MCAVRHRAQLHCARRCAAAFCSSGVRFSDSAVCTYHTIARAVLPQPAVASAVHSLRCFETGWLCAQAIEAVHDARTTTFTEQRYHFDLPNFDGRAADMCLTADGTLHVLAVAPLVLYSFKKPSAGASTAWCDPDGGRFFAGAAVTALPRFLLVATVGLVPYTYKWCPTRFGFAGPQPHSVPLCAAAYSACTEGQPVLSRLWHWAAGVLRAQV